MLNAPTRKPRIVSVVALDGRDETSLLRLAAGCACGLEAPLAAAIVDGARERDIAVIEVERMRQTTGTGVAASVGGHTVVIGNAALFTDLGLSLDTLDDWADRLRRRGQQVLFVAVDGRPAGFLGIADAAD